MDVRLLPAPLRGAVTPPPSKSLLHRQLICLAQAGEFPCPPDPSDDVEATVRGLWALYHEKAPVIDCGASGSTLRFLLPLAMARGQVGTVFTGTERLLAKLRAVSEAMGRPWPGYVEAILKKQGIDRLEWAYPEDLRRVVASMEYQRKREAA